MTLSPVSRSGNAHPTPPSKVAEIDPIVRIARSLSAAQRRCLLGIRYADEYLLNSSSRSRTQKSVIALRLAEPSGRLRWHWRLTPLGLAVRSYLQSQSREKQG